MNIIQLQSLPIREEAIDRMRIKNQDCIAALNQWSNAHPNHSIRVTGYLEETGLKRLIIRAEGDNADQVQAVQAIIERLYMPIVPKEQEILKPGG